MKYLSIFVACLLAVGSMQAQKVSLPRTTPADVKLDPVGVEAYLLGLKANDVEIHSLMIVRDGKVAYEKWFAGQSPDSVHILNSVSKTFTATAVGLAIGEGLFTLNDKVISFFPDDLPAIVSPYLAQLRIWDLLTMTAGQAKEPARMGDNWIKGFLATPIAYQPGTRFYYNSLASFMLSAIVQKVTGKTVFDYLTPRIFEPLGIHNIFWQTNPQGINVGGWGLFVKTEDLAKFGQLYLQDGVWNGKRLLPEGWVAEASKLQIENPSGWPGDGPLKPGDDWAQGYAFQMWRCKHNGYRMDGANGQFVFLIPEKNTVIAITSNTRNTGPEISLLWDTILPALH
jgi:CubicO group peptidase (beta-lactamase class C family)